MFKGFCTAQKTIDAMKKQPMEWEEMFANHTPDEGLRPKIYKGDI